ncbi:quinoprotein dehydrogenase-associated putative ABC transporter substrate-binding protein [Azospirillum rugosum]|uniref:Quinoprotein dehydrogenase-associated probable ABC transporter substrate-binding protein/PQQ-dependent catabolism-associated CXXCW motif protein n=1 Tax=Azospirillum rugosum TaxID=416170 RepID=A0ABS4SUQ5_9PROT|nr:quinoprotein dehydrogenase-associated putative ABC transporter substrate-binding protein [Azospirillum rugosum]MBP2296308.1 quinoprotein dehydrogenase-associated probable ABC transporter substrate-binding protein/PQQ-dependent catabolism-associated CXXCW motif protein [Azospirillum rugosum]MDQ0529829.1 quinoprotein dehydrogenase-associated probable ABC transporter substrate-binding protein/PQQ-dependent catabolism-associated CXXCW motif protein [Azospirillum rugosum]
MAALLAGAAASPALAVEVTEREAVRVCADGNLLPFSNEKMEGFENEIAKLIGEDLKKPVTYTWWPQTIGFVRNTLGARKCDLVMGTASGEELMQNTNPYYRTVYALVYRTKSGIRAESVGDPALKDARIGVVERTPAVNLLRRYGITKTEPYQLNTDTRVNNPARDAIADVATGKTDAAVIWGPIAGYFAAQQSEPLTVVPLIKEPAVAHLQFNISMGIRGDEPEWKHWLNDFIKRRQDDIDRILLRYHVPIIGPDGTLKTADASAPPGYRMDNYRAPTPAGLTGASTVTVAELRGLIERHPDTRLVDVMPTPPRPADRAPPAVWAPPPRRSLPGAVWLPNVGYGSLSTDQERYFRAGLDAVSKGESPPRLVFFCEPDCWMSWNAAKRAVEWGYSNVYWYADGATRWQEAGYALETVQPFAGGGASN